MREREQGRSDVRDGDIEAIGDHGVLIYTQYIQLNMLDLQITTMIMTMIAWMVC